MISVAIMAHPSRKQWIPGLVDALDTEPTVVLDQHNDRWDTGRRSLLAYDPTATHHLVIQDDAIVSRNLVASLTRAAEVSHHRPVAAYMGRNHRYRREVDIAVRQRAVWIEASGPWWGVAILVPTSDIPEIVQFGDERTDIENYDRKIGTFYGARDIRCWYTYPSLVEHRNDYNGGGRNPSLITGRIGTRRRSWRFHGERGNALNIDWDGRIVAIGPVPPKGRSGRERSHGRRIEVQAVQSGASSTPGAGEETRRGTLSSRRAARLRTNQRIVPRG